MPSYDPFTRGPHPVGVRTETWTDRLRTRALDVEIWFPASEAARGRDLDASTQDRFDAVWADEGTATQAAMRDAEAGGVGPHPLVLLVHGFAGFRREATFVGTHLASHGYLVVSADHAGSTSWDVEAGLSGTAPMPSIRRMGVDRRGDVPFLVDQALARLPADPGAIGVTGASFGGWTSLVAPAVDARVRAIAPMCPAGGETDIFGPDDNALMEDLDLTWKRDLMPTLLMVGDRDSWVPLHGQMGIFKRLPPGSRMVIMRGADHSHFVDDIPTSHRWLQALTDELGTLLPDGPGRWKQVADRIVPYEDLADEVSTYAAWRGLTVAHFDAALRHDRAAATLVEDHLEDAAASVGADVLTVVR